MKAPIKFRDIVGLTANLFLQMGGFFDFGSRKISNFKRVCNHAFVKHPSNTF